MKAHKTKCGIRARARAANGDEGGACRAKEAIAAAFHLWHLRTYGCAWVEYGMRGAIARDAQSH